jgi:dipeptide/tripeptide permease
MASLVSGDKEAQISGDPGSKRGGWITFPFMLATLLGLSVTSFGWVMNLIVFLIEEFNIKSIAAAQISNVANGCLSMLPVVAAILADSFFGNIPVIAASSFISLLGIVLLTLIASLDYLRPRPCEAGSVLCTPPSKLHLGILYTALALVTTGAGGTRFTMASAGANQYEKPKEQGSFFNWYFLTLYAGAITGATAIVYIQDNASWKLGFGLCAAANLISFIVFVSGKRYYKHDKPMGSPFTSLIRVVVSATVKRKAVISCNEEDYHHYGLEKEVKTSAAMPSKSFR